MNATTDSDKEFVRLVAEQMQTAKGFFEYGVKRGLMTPADVRLTVAKRQEEARALVEKGLSRRKAAEILGVSHGTINRAVGSKSSKSGSKLSTKAKRIAVPEPLATDPIQDDCQDCVSSEQEWQHSFSHFAGDAVAIDDFWRRQFGAWEKFEVPSSFVMLAKQAAKAWKELATKLEKLGETNG